MRNGHAVEPDPPTKATSDPQAEANFFCLGCHYNLRGLKDPRCPECGRPFDPDNPETYYLGRKGRPMGAIAQRWCRRPGLTVPIVSGVLSASTLWVGTWPLGINEEVLTILAVVWGGLLIWWFLRCWPFIVVAEMYRAPGWIYTGRKCWLTPPRLLAACVLLCILPVFCCAYCMFHSWRGYL